MAARQKAKGNTNLVVALYDAGGKRIADANVDATVGEIGMAGTRKILEPMHIGNATTLGNYFSTRGGMFEYRFP